MVNMQQTLTRQVPTLSSKVTHTIDVCEVDNENSVSVPSWARAVLISLDLGAPNNLDAFLRFATGAANVGIEIVRSQERYYLLDGSIDTIYHQGEGTATESTNLRFTWFP